MRIKPALYSLQQLAHPLLHFAVAASPSPIPGIPLSSLHPRSTNRCATRLCPPSHSPLWPRRPSSAATCPSSASGALEVGTAAGLSFSSRPGRRRTRRATAERAEVGRARAPPMEGRAPPRHPSLADEVRSRAGSFACHHGRSATPPATGGELPQ
jgi:hypothetical protein